MIKNELELARKILKSDASEDARALAAHYMNLPFALTDSLKALEYGIECTLATVIDLILRSKPPLSETRRQISIAQKMLWDFYPATVEYGYELKKLRVKEVINNYNQNVLEWALASYAKDGIGTNVDKLRGKLTK